MFVFERERAGGEGGRVLSGNAASDEDCPCSSNNNNGQGSK